MRRICSIRYSSPGYPNPGRRQKPHKLSQRISSAARFAPAVRELHHMVGKRRIAVNGQEFLPSPSACSSLAGNSSCGDRLKSS